MEHSWTWTKPSSTQIVLMLVIAALLAWSMASGEFTLRAIIRGIVVALAVLCVTLPTKVGQRSTLAVLLCFMFIALAAVLHANGW